MEKRTKWGIVAVVGVVVAIIGAVLLVTGLSSEQRFHVDQSVNKEFFAYSFHAKDGEPSDVKFDLSQGTMTVAFISSEGLADLREVGELGAQNYFLKSTDQSNGTMVWTPEKADTYYVVFYQFSQPGGTLKADVTFTGTFTMWGYLGIVLIVVGVVVLIVGAIMYMKTPRPKPAAAPQAQTQTTPPGT